MQISSSFDKNNKVSLAGNISTNLSAIPTISIIGLGLLGTLLATSFAKKGHRVIAVDMDQRKVNCINQSNSPIQDKELQDSVRMARRTNHLIATSDLHHAVQHSDISLVCIGTAISESDVFFLKKLSAVCQQLGASLKKKSAYHLVLLHSETRPDVCEQQAVPILELWSNKKCGRDFGCCYLPLYLEHKVDSSQSKIVDSILHGAFDNKSAKLAVELFAQLDIGLKTVSLKAL